jgi:glutathione reductase (NADPH)
MIAGIPASLGELMNRRGVEVIRGRGRFVGPNAVTVRGETLEAKHVVIATGSRPRRLPFPGVELMITSDDVLSERRLPASVVFVGGGGIALEFSRVYARAGVKVTILEALPRLLGNRDADAVAQLRRETERIGVTIHTGVEVRLIARAGERLRVVHEEGGAERAAEADRVVNGAGRVANVDALDLAAGEVQAERQRIALDPHLRSTSNPGGHVCGDAVAEHAQLSPIASYEGRIVGRNIVEGPKHVASIPSCVFTVPALASVGLTQASAEANGIEHRTAVNDMHQWLSGRTYAETAASSKVLIDKKTDRIVGAHLFGHAAEELIHIFALAIKQSPQPRSETLSTAFRPSPPTSSRCCSGAPTHSLSRRRGRVRVGPRCRLG